VAVAGEGRGLLHRSSGHPRRSQVRMVPLAVAQAGDEVLLNCWAWAVSTFVEVMDGPLRLLIFQFACLFITRQGLPECMMW